MKKSFAALPYLLFLDVSGNKQLFMPYFNSEYNLVHRRQPFMRV